MDRRKSIKTLFISTAAAGTLLDGCNTSDKKTPDQPAVKAAPAEADRMNEEKTANKKLQEDNFFTRQEMAVIAVLADIIIPKDAVSGSATDAAVPDFIEFIVKDMPQHQTPMRGGLRWLEMESLKRFEKDFVAITAEQRLQIIDDIAYPANVKPGMQPGIAFFSRMRDLTSSGFYTAEIGVKDIGYAGNTPSQWNGVPEEVLQQYGLSYTERELRECISFERS